MKRELRITSEPIDESTLVTTRSMSHGMGAAIYFAGVVRGIEDDAAISAIDYEAFMQMAEHQFQFAFRSDGTALAHRVRATCSSHRRRAGERTVALDRSNRTAPR
jgi:molybdopterin synthase catalytic subunit